MTRFSSLTKPDLDPSRASHELRRVLLELEFERGRLGALARAASIQPKLALKAGAAEVRVAALRARAAQLRRAAGLDSAV